jgi:hypothetical protein
MVRDSLAPSVPVVCLAVKPAGKLHAGNRHVRFDEPGWETGHWPKAQATAPILDSTLASNQRPTLLSGAWGRPDVVAVMLNRR